MIGFRALRSRLDAAQEPEPFLMATSLHIPANHFARGDIECCERRRYAMAFVVRHGLYGQAAGSGLFVDRENQCLARRVEVEADNILYFRDEAFVVRQLESLDQMRNMGQCRLPRNARDRRRLVEIADREEAPSTQLIAHR
jgi:hypothetical protein